MSRTPTAIRENHFLTYNWRSKCVKISKQPQVQATHHDALELFRGGMYSHSQ